MSSERKETREHLIHLLTEACEIEHNLLCSYIYAALSLKSSEEDGLRAQEAEAVRGWRKAIMSVAIEEMGHLVLVNNLLVAVGGAAHFDRANFPVPAGYHPASFVIRLTPFTRATLDHFLFLERPGDIHLRDGTGFSSDDAAPRHNTPGTLTPSGWDYETIGEFYGEIRELFAAHAERHGADAFIDGGDQQIGPDVVELPGIRVIRNLDDARLALQTIVEQGEGASSCHSDCHYERFNRIAKEWAALATNNPDFVPTLPAAHDPVMRCPAPGCERVWVTAEHASRLLDFGNAVYALTLSLLEHAYAPLITQDERKQSVGAAISLMHVVSTVGAKLARLPAADDGAINAGLTFAVPRNLKARHPRHAKALFDERLAILQEAARSLLGHDLDAHFERARM